MIKLTKTVDSLEHALAKLRERCNILEDREETVIRAAKERDHRLKETPMLLTAAEENRIDKIRRQIREAEEEQNAIANALEYLYEYAE